MPRWMAILGFYRLTLMNFAMNVSKFVLHRFDRISYVNLNSRQKENYAYQKVSAVLADYGFVTMRLSDDWQGADFIAQHIDGKTMLRVQLKGRMTIEKKYLGKDLYICFREKEQWYFVPHDEFVDWARVNTTICTSFSWAKNGGYSVPSLSVAIKAHLEQYRI